MTNIPKLLAVSLMAGLLSSAVAAQTVVLAEDFSSGVPPTGWSHMSLGGTGWIPDAAGRAWHEDESGGHTAENYLVSPAFDMSGLAAGYLHFDSEVKFSSYLANHPASNGDGVSNLELSLDGGATWQVVWTDTSQSDAARAGLTVDLNAFVGQPSVILALHYYGTYAHEWWVDNIQVDDNPNPPPPPPTVWSVNLPSGFVTAPFVENFDGLGGMVPPYMAMTMLDAATLAPDPEAWCNIGQLGPMSVPSYSGGFNLEMGLLPISTNYHAVRNAMVLGVNGNGVSGLNLDFAMIDHGEEVDPFDGVWISSDGLNWYPVQKSWAGTSIWAMTFDLAIEGLGVDTTAPFYLMFAQQDNFPYADLDGVGIDDVTVDTGTGSNLPTLTVTGLVAGGTAVLQVDNATAGDTVHYVYSLSGGSTPTPYGFTLDMGMPINILGTATADPSGTATYTAGVPLGVTGLPVFLQAVTQTPPSSFRVTNMVNQAIG